MQSEATVLCHLLACISVLLVAVLYQCVRTFEFFWDQLHKVQQAQTLAALKQSHAISTGTQTSLSSIGVQTRDASTSIGEIEFGFLEAEFPVPLIVTTPANLTLPAELNSSSEVDLRSNTIKSEKVRSNNQKNLVEEKMVKVN